MKLTKEECKLSLNWFKGATCMECSNNYPNCYSKCIEKYYNTLDQLIKEHFDNNLSRTCQNLVSEVDKLEKALDKACEKLATVIYIEDCNGFCGHMPPYKNCMCDTKEFWKEYLLNENIR